MLCRVSRYTRFAAYDSGIAGVPCVARGGRLLPARARFASVTAKVGMSTSASACSGIFISYRRTDSAYPAGWLYDRLAEHFGRTQVFKDVDSLQPGDDFVEVITTAVASCVALIAVIGERWLTAADEHGRRRLDNPEDFVRVEIEAALARGVRVIPVLVNGASMPRSADLPSNLQPLARRQAIELSPYRFDTGALIRVLDATISGIPATPASAGDAIEATAPRPDDGDQPKLDAGATSVAMEHVLRRQARAAGWSWEAYATELNVPPERIDVGRRLVEAIVTAVRERDLPWRVVMRKGYVAIQRPGGYNVLVVDLWWNRVPRLAAKLPSEPAGLGLASPYPRLPEVWVPAEREWGWTIAAGTPLPDVRVLIDLIRPFQPLHGPMAALARPTATATASRSPYGRTTAQAGEILEAAIQRLESSGASRNAREAVDGLLAMGYELRLAQTATPGKTPENYLRILDPGYTAHVIGYLTPTMFSFSRTLDRERLSGLPGAALVSNAVNFSHVESAQPGLTAARLLHGERQDRNVNKAASTPPGVSSAVVPERTAFGGVRTGFGDVQVTADQIEEAIAWCLNTAGRHSSFTSAMKNRRNKLADWAEQNYPGLKTWDGKQPPPKPQIAAYLRRALAGIQES